MRIKEMKDMGTFSGWFKVGAGATLGSLTAIKGMELGEAVVDATIKNAYNNYRSTNFDPIVRADLNELLVLNRLKKIEYPFPNSKNEKKENFFKRHPLLTGILILYVILEAMITMMGMQGNFNQNIAAILSIVVFLLVIGACILAVKKVFKTGSKKITQSTYKNALDKDGEQYWYVREYIRQALEKKELSPKEAILKISNTRLAQQFPDSAEEIDANEFYYRQQLGL